MPIVQTPKGLIFFAHVPKTGGSSVEDYLVRRFGGPLSLIDNNKNKGVLGTGLITPATHLAVTDLRELLPRLHYSFAVVRDPLSRLQSEYRYQSGVSRMSRFSFSSWIRIMLGACRQDLRIYENHIRPQSDLVPDGSEIFRLEDGFDEMIARLDAVTGTVAPEEKVGHLLKRKREEIAMSRQDAALIAEFYEADYARFGYTRPDPSGLPNDPYSALRGAIALPFARAVVAKQRHDWMQ